MTDTDSGLESDFEFAALEAATFYRRGIAQEFADELVGDILEVGAGIGQMTKEFAALKRVSSVTALEPDPRFWTLFHRRLPSIRLIEGTIDRLPPNELFQSAVMINVLEHIEDDTEELRRIRAHLSLNGGSLCLLVPARPELYSAIDRKFGHYRRYTRPGLKKVLSDAGFVVTRLSYFNFIGYLLWAINFRLLGAETFDAKRVQMFDRYIFRTTHRIERTLCRPLIGQSLLAVAKRFDC